MKKIVLSMLFTLIFVVISSLIFSNFASAEEDISVLTDKKLYFLRDTVNLTGEINKLLDEDNVNIFLINPDGDVVRVFETEVDREEKKYRYKLSLIGNFLNIEGLYKIKTTYAESEANTSFLLFFSPDTVEKLESTIELDKEIYSWTDTVEIFVFAPSYNKSNRIEYIGKGSGSEGKIEIIIGLEKLENYRLIETAHDSGVFHGKILLTGDPTVDVNRNNRQDDATGLFSDKYPFDGQLPAKDNQIIKVIFSDSDEEVEQTSQIKWSAGKMGWVEKNYKFGSSSLLRVVDKDMDLRPNAQDHLIVNGRTRISYDDYDYGIEIKLTETGPRTGIFEGFVKYNVSNQLFYYDKTVPNLSKTDYLKITPNHDFKSEPKEPTPETSQDPQSNTESKNESDYKPDILDALNPGFLIYHNPTFDIKLEYPDNWQVIDDSTGTALDVKFISSRENMISKSQNGVEVLVFDLPNPQTLEDHAEKHIEYLKNTFSKFELVDSSETILGGVPAHRVEYSYIGSIPEKWIEVFAFIDQRIYLMAFSANSIEFSNYSPTFQKIQDSFEIETDYSIPQETVEKIQIPEWIKTNAYWWAEGKIEDKDFVSGIQFLIKEKIMQIPQTAKGPTSTAEKEIPPWIKNNAEWWSQGLITDDDFVKGIQYLVEQGIIKV